MTLTQHQIVMDKQEQIVHSNDSIVLFHSENEEYTLSNEVWNDMQRPKKITVTIAPGDTLND